MTSPIKVSPTTIGLTSALVLGLAAPALAGIAPPTTGEAFLAADLDASGGLSKTEFATFLEAGLTTKEINSAFKNADVNRSKEVTLLELRYHLGEVELPTKNEISFEAADNDGNGFLDRGDFNLAVGHLRSRGIDLLRRFLQADVSNDGRITLDEWSVYLTGKAKGPEGASFLVFDLLDQYKDEKISSGEYTWFYTGETRQSKIAAAFYKLDKNEDGYLTRDEWNPGAKKR